MEEEKERMATDCNKVDSLKKDRDRAHRDLHALEIQHKISLIKMDTINTELSDFTSQIH